MLHFTDLFLCSKTIQNAGLLTQQKIIQDFNFQRHPVYCGLCICFIHPVYCGFGKLDNIAGYRTLRLLT